MSNQPVVTVGLVETFLVALFLALVGTGIIPLSTDQVELWKTVIIAGCALGAPIVGSLYLNRATTDAAKPTDTDGTPLVRADNREPSARAAAAGRFVAYELDDSGATKRGANDAAFSRPVWSK